MDSARPTNARSFDVFASACPSRDAFGQIFSHWGMLVLAKLSSGGMRFGELRRAVDGISERMLSRTLKALEQEGLVHREEWDQKPPRVEYRLTDGGRRISKSIISVIDTLYEEMEERRP